ncbi:hypothetical protein EES43_24630 [Streptomyces sp. ADI96-02]|uniref:hypothetical protein n=1 Tax=Streptomyces sp. ADI96-02 TaxID=1522760 RepID=UPI000F54DF41|nr:hypothetical protein [Streptomyces sp. ADI96-02]RPK56232.1 hypothetical protein EES43_24630 [Streptomyces sp. ADI96-02]
MVTPLVLPDGKKVAIDLLSAGMPGVLVTSKLPEGKALTAALPVVRVLRIGGTSTMRGWSDPATTDRPRFSIDCYAPDEGAAMRLALRVCAAWELFPGRSTGDATVSAISQETGPQDRPEEPNTGIARVGMILGMSVRPPLPNS